MRAAKRVADDAAIPCAWVLVSVYYAAFFAAVELLRATGVWVTYFDESQVQGIKSSAIGSPSLELSAGTYIGRAHWDSHSGLNRIVFSRVAGSPHKVVWKEIGDGLLSPAVASDAALWDQVQRFERFVGRGANDWGTPSETRNKWNYQQAALFGGRGEVQGRTLRKIVRNQSSAYAWATDRRLRRSEESRAAAVGYVMFVLEEIIAHTNDIVAPSGK
jgi:hypothetical protein